MGKNVTAALAADSSCESSENIATLCSKDKDKGMQCGSDSSMIAASTWRIHNLLTANELVFESWLAMSARGLFLTYAIPSISSVLTHTGGFNKDVARRYADMELLIREFNECAIDGTTSHDGMPHRAKLACHRLNAIHSQYAKVITYRDMVYVLCIFALSPSTWFGSRWSWRDTTPQERQCIFLHWANIGAELGLDIRSHFKSWDDMRGYKAAFEAKHMRYAASNKTVGYSTIDFFVHGTIPTFLQSTVRPVVLQLMSILQETPQHAEALGLPKANPILAVIVDVLLTTRAVLCKYLLPPRPLSFKDRLTGVEGHESKQIATKEVFGISKCPFSVQYRPRRPLDFNNTTYSPEGTPGSAYTIENMGPASVEIGKLEEKPQYLGSKEKHII